MRILAIDLGKFKCVSCLLDSGTNETRFDIVATVRYERLRCSPR